MADSKISQLTPITGANILDSDEFIIARPDTFENFAVTRAEMFLDTPAITTSEVTTDAATVNGNITVTGTVDGRDVAADGSKLDGIESNADVTDTANVTAAGALMDSELTSEASVKALDQGVATTDSPDFAGLIVDTDTLYVNSTSNRVGIGTTNLGEKLVVSRLGGEPAAIPTLDSNTAALFHSGDGATGSGAALTLLGGTTSSCSLLFADTDDGNIGSIAYSHSTNAMLFRVNNSERMRIDSSGNVGIGTSSPDSPLDIRYTGPGTGFQLTRTDVTDTKLQIGWSGADLNFNTSGASKDIVFRQNNTEAMRIDDTGNVGIGTSSPGSALQVEGTITGSAVTQSEADATAGRLLKVGDAGILDFAIDNVSGDLNDPVWGAAQRFGVGELNTPEKGSVNTAGVVKSDKWNANAGLQTAHLFFPPSKANTKYIRVFESGVWGDWQKVYTTGNAVGTISGGALIESGSTANGNYTKFANGTMICTINNFDLTYVNAVNCRSDWDFPVSFSSVPAISGIVHLNATLINATPELDELMPIGWSNSGDNNNKARLSVRRVAGGTDFQSGDFVRLQSVTAIGEYV
jgi:hypothetical protein